MFWRLQKIYSYFESYLGFGLTQVDEITPGTKPYVVCPTQPIPCLLMLWWLIECQAIIRINAGMLLIGGFGTKWNLSRNTIILFQENAFENVLCKMAEILSQTRYVNGACVYLLHFHGAIQCTGVISMLYLDNVIFGNHTVEKSSDMSCTDHYANCNKPNIIHGIYRSMFLWLFMSTIYSVLYTDKASMFTLKLVPACRQTLSTFSAYGGQGNRSIENDLPMQ